MARLAGDALIGRDRDAGSLVLRFRATAGVEQRVREWAALERECCPFLTMRVTVTAADVALRIDGPPEAAGIIDELLPAVAERVRAVQRRLTAVRRRRSAPIARAADAAACRGSRWTHAACRRRPPSSAAVPAAPVALLTTGSGRLALYRLRARARSRDRRPPRLWPGWSRLGGLILTAPVMVTMIVPVFFALFLAFFALCASYQTQTYLSAGGAAAAICAFFLPTRWAQPGRWPDPAARSGHGRSSCSPRSRLSIVVLALVEGGPHHCET